MFIILDWGKNKMGELLEEFKKYATNKGLNVARSHGLFWWRETQEEWERFKIYYGICGDCGGVFSLARKPVLIVGNQTFLQWRDKMITGWYYLHTNGDLIYKRELGGTAADIRESDFAKALWPIDPTDRKGAWDILVESLASGADKSRVQQLALKWNCNDKDAQHYANAINAKIFKDGNQWCITRQDFINLQESPAGFGDTCLGAFAELAKKLGYKPSKMWGAKFSDLLK